MSVALLSLQRLLTLRRNVDTRIGAQRAFVLASDLFADKVNQICQAVRSILLTRDLSTYINAILTTYVCQQPQDYESALQLVKQVKGQ